MSVFFDAHVHIYSDFPVTELLDAALKNFLCAAADVDDRESRDYVLCLAENRNLDVFSQLQKNVSPVDSFTAGLPLPSPGRWQYYETKEPSCLIAQNGEGSCIYILAGRQIISSEHLEILCLCTAASFPDTTFPLEVLADKIWTAGGVPLLPWGLGKWLGKRGSAVDKFLCLNHNSPIVLGDNGNRPFFWPRAKQFTTALNKLYPIANGSDPLPLAKHHLRVGSYGGWVAQRRVDTSRPATDIKAIITQERDVVPFGKQAGLIQFFRDQLLLQLDKIRARTKQ